MAALRSLSWLELIVLLAALAYAVLRTSRSIWLLAQPDLDVCDIKRVYITWDLWRSGQAHTAAGEVTYLPYTYVFLTPLFALGWPVVRALSYVINGVSALFILQRLATWTELPDRRRLFLYVFFFCWLCTGLVFGLGNLAMLSLAGAVAAYPIRSSAQTSIGLLLAAMKHSVSAPIFPLAFFRRPKVVLLTGAVLLATIALTFVLTGVTLTEFLHGLQAGKKVMQVWEKENETVSLSQLFTGTAKTIVPLLICAGLFVWTLRWNDLLKTFAAVLIVAMLPIHHRFYDLVVLAPALAILLRELPLIWAGGLTFLLSGWLSSVQMKYRALEGPVNFVYLALLLALYGLLAWLDRDRAPAVARVKASEAGPSRLG